MSAALRPAFLHALTYVSRLLASCSTPPRKSEFSIGTPRRAVASIVSGLVHTTYTGGGGRWGGFGVTRAPGVLKGGPPHAEGPHLPPLLKNRPPFSEPPPVSSL